LIYELSAQGITVMVSTHYMDEAEYCTQIGVMRDGKLLALAEPDELKRQLPGHVWEVAAEPLLGALETLAQQPFVRNAALSGDRLRVITDAAVTAEQIAATLRSAAMTPQHIAPGVPTIEDVFMALANRD
jgi:ABC-2 type transport system ATP-binding protein